MSFVRECRRAARKRAGNPMTHVRDGTVKGHGSHDEPTVFTCIYENFKTKQQQQ